MNQRASEGKRSQGFHASGREGKRRMESPGYMDRSVYDHISDHAWLHMDQPQPPMSPRHYSGEGRDVLLSGYERGDR